MKIFSAFYLRHCIFTFSGTDLPSPTPLHPTPTRSHRPPPPSPPKPTPSKQKRKLFWAPDWEMSRLWIFWPLGLGFQGPREGCLLLRSPPPRPRPRPAGLPLLPVLGLVGGGRLKKSGEGCEDRRSTVTSVLLKQPDSVWGWKSIPFQHEESWAPGLVLIQKKA